MSLLKNITPIVCNKLIIQLKPLGGLGMKFEYVLYHIMLCFDK